MLVSIECDRFMSEEVWADSYRPVWQYRPHGESEWRDTAIPARHPLKITAEVADMPKSVLVRWFADGCEVFMGAAVVTEVPLSRRKRPPADHAGDAGMTSITVAVPPVKDPEMRDASVPMRWLFGLPAPHLPGGVRWHETQLPACRLTQLLLRVPEEDPTAYLALPGERLAIKIVLPGLPSDCASLSVVALPFAAGVN